MYLWPDVFAPSSLAPSARSQGGLCHISHVCSIFPRDRFQNPHVLGGHGLVDRALRGQQQRPEHSQQDLEEVRAGQSLPHRGSGGQSEMRGTLLSG